MLGMGQAGAGHAESWGGNEVARWKQGRSQLLLVIKWVFLAWFLELRSPHVLLDVDVFPCHFLFYVQEVWGAAVPPQFRGMCAFPRIVTERFTAM